MVCDQDVRQIVHQEEEAELFVLEGCRGQKALNSATPLKRVFVCLPL